jgi:hypothetical protein
MKKSETREAARLALVRFVHLGKEERDTADYSTVVYRNECQIIVTFVSPTKRNPDRLTQHVYSIDCKFQYATSF